MNEEIKQYLEVKLIEGSAGYIYSGLSMGEYTIDELLTETYKQIEELSDKEENKVLETVADILNILIRK